MASITFKSVGHFFATVIEKVLPAIRKTETTVEAVSAAVPTYGPLVLPIEKVAYAVLGEFAAALNAGGAAASSKFADAGLDINVIQTVEAVVASLPQFSALIKAL